MHAVLSIDRRVLISELIIGDINHARGADATGTGGATGTGCATGTGIAADSTTTATTVGRRRRGAGERWEVRRFERPVVRR